MSKKQDKEKIKLSEKLALNFRKKWLVSGIQTFLIIAILIMGYVSLNLFVRQLDLPQIDVTENKLYTLTEASKNAVSKIDKEVTVYAYGFEEDSTLIDLMKQYKAVNDKISYEILTEESNFEMVQSYSLSSGYYVLIIKSGDSEKLIDASTQFSSYDYVTNQTIDTTEQVITNSMLALIEENKPKIYFTQGHGEYDSSIALTLESQLTNEAYEHEYLNIATRGSIPEDCDVLAIISPSSDFLDAEVAAISDYINKGGDIYYAMDVVSQEVSYINLQKVLDQYGVSIQNGYIFELANNQQLAEYPYIFMPQASSTHEITRDIYTDSYMWLVYAGRLNFKSDTELQALKATKEILLSSTEEALFVTDFQNDMTQALTTAQASKSDIAAAITKKVTPPGASEETESKLVVISSGNFMADFTMKELNQSYPMSYIGSNMDFAINSMAFLAGKDNLLTIRKEYNSSTYTPTNIQNLVVVLVIIFVPILIIATGIIIGAWRKRRK